MGLLGLTAILATCALIIDILLLPLTVVFDRTGYIAHRLNGWVATIALATFVNVRIEGLENVPAGKPFVWASNHQSTLDAFIYGTVAHYNQRVMFKAEMKWWPIFGQLFLLAGHVPVNRSDPDSGRKSLAAMVDLLKSGISAIFFPEGTRFIPINNGEAMKVFKPGAALAAIRANVDILPLSLSGVRVALPMYGFPSLGWEEIRIKVHPPISTKGLSSDKAKPDVDRLILELRDTIASGLRPCDFYAGREWEEHQKTFTDTFLKQLEQHKQKPLHEKLSLAATAANAKIGIPPDTEAIREAAQNRQEREDRIKEAEKTT